MNATPLTPGDGLTSWAIAPEWGYPDAAVAWLWFAGWCFPLRLQAGLNPTLALPPHPALFLPTPFPAIRDEGPI